MKMFAVTKMMSILNTTLKPCTRPSTERLIIHHCQKAFSLVKNNAFIMIISTKNQNIRLTEPIAVHSDSPEMQISTPTKQSTRA